MTNDAKYYFDMGSAIPPISPNVNKPTRPAISKQHRHGKILSPAESGHDDFSTVGSATNYSTISAHTSSNNESNIGEKQYDTLSRRIERITTSNRLSDRSSEPTAENRRKHDFDKRQIRDELTQFQQLYVG